MRLIGSTVFQRLALSCSFERSDWLAAAVAFCISFIIYAYTAAPNVTLLDSGEFIVAAQHFGVAHPTGYPLWTLGAWLFTQLPLGNVAWEVNLFSGLCAAFAIGIAALLMSNSIDWLQQTFHAFGYRACRRKLKSPGEFKAYYISILAVCFSLTLALSVPMWTQSVIAEVYTLHALLGLLWITALYQWVRMPHQLGWLAISFFFYALGLSNHHLGLAWAPVPLLLILLLRRDLFIEFLAYLALIAALILWGFAAISDDPQTPLVDNPALETTALRFLLCVGMGSIILLWGRKRLIYWKWGIALFVAILLGLAPYIYMPLASSTNPPMNWGYARTKAGFFYSINRSQYQGSLSTRLENTLGKLVGAASSSELLSDQAKLGGAKSLFLFCGLYWKKIWESFHILSLCFFLAGFVSLLFVSKKQRIWLLGLFTTFLLAAFLEPLMDSPAIDSASWRVQMPYHTSSFAFFTLLAGTGAAFCIERIMLLLEFYFFSSALSVSERMKKLRLLAALALCALPFYAFFSNEAICSQRGHLFGWKFGRDLLEPLPRGSVFFGGTDPGRFVPTYMIFGESVLPAAQKRDPKFDRGDLYIITQNALGDLFYLKYLRDHYSDQRPAAKGWFERSLGRKEIYPKEVLILPTDQEVVEIVDKLRAQGAPVEENPILLHSAVAEWIFQKNKIRHTFFVEESFPMSWSYPYAIPQGLCYKLNTEPLAQLSKEIIKQDQMFWSRYIQELLLDPHFTHDIDAQKSFSKLRLAAGRIYQFRGLLDEAEVVYRQALQIYCFDEEALGLLVALLLDQRRFDEALALAKNAWQQDPYNIAFAQIWSLVQRRQTSAEQIEKLAQELMEDPNNSQVLHALLQEYVSARDFLNAEALIESNLKRKPKDSAPYQLFIDYYSQLSRFDDALRVAKLWDEAQPQQAEVKLAQTKLFFLRGSMQEFYANARQAVILGGVDARQRLALDPLFQSISGQSEFVELLQTPIHSAVSSSK